MNPIPSVGFAVYDRENTIMGAGSGEEEAREEGDRLFMATPGTLIPDNIRPCSEGIFALPRPIPARAWLFVQEWDIAVTRDEFDAAVPTI